MRPSAATHRPFTSHGAGALAAPAGSAPSLAALLLAVATALALAAVAPAATPSGADAVLGTWRTEAGEQGGRARVEISRQGGRFVGTIVALEEPNFPADHERAGQPKVDLENPDPAKRERPIAGLRILSGFTWAGDAEWTGGTIYDPANGKTYKARMRLADRDTLDVRGYVGVPLFGRTTTWKRVD
ncbi:MAG TPA: DUF2147 domain-containing protein [Thermoanaerobaculia bacterium]|nr:DUF2147 domain-containing protein [Thermoanaerobaculia bacterium]